MSARISSESAYNALAISLMSSSFANLRHTVRYLSKVLRTAALIVPVNTLTNESSFMKIFLSFNSSGNSLETFSIEFTRTSCLSLFSFESKAGRQTHTNEGYFAKIFPSVSLAAWIICFFLLYCIFNKASNTLSHCFASFGS